MAYSTIPKSSSYFNTKIYTGNGSAGHSITGVGFQPDWVWIKTRSDSNNHTIFDAVRGVTKRLRSNQNNAENTSSGVTSFDSDGFTVGTDSAGNSGTMVSWNWKANGLGSSNTDGTINTTYTSANTTSGMSIIQYNGNGSAGATIGHGLGVAPKCVIIKRTDTTSNWIFGTGATGFTKFLYLNTTDAETTNAGAFNNTAPSSSVITLGSWNDVNNSSGTYICYAFAEKTGFSKFGSYIGNANADGPFIYTGFKPAFVLLKTSSYAESWIMIDNQRLGYNGSSALLRADDSGAEVTTLVNPDFLSNGFKVRNTNNWYNKNSETYIYMAFGQPIVSTNGDIATAR